MDYKGYLLSKVPVLNHRKNVAVSESRVILDAYRMPKSVTKVLTSEPRSYLEAKVYVEKLILSKQKTVQATKL